MRALDWSSTPLGPPERWPQPLKTMVGVILAADQAMFVVWGAERTMLYNDAYAEILGGKHPRALARPFFETWAELVESVGPIMERGYAGVPSSMDAIELVMLRKGYPETTFFSFFYAPLRDEVAGRVEGVYCACVEITERVAAERRAAFRGALEARLREMQAPREIMAAAAQMLARRLGVDRVGYAEMEPDGAAAVVHADWSAHGVASIVGRHRLASYGPGMEAALREGRTVAVGDVAADPLAWGATTRDAYAAVGVKAHVALPLVRTGRLAALLFVHAAAPRHWSPDDLALVRDVGERTWEAVERARAEAELRESEARLRELADNISQFVWMADASGAIYWLNKRSLDYSGKTLEELQGWGWRTVHHPDHVDRVVAKLSRAYAAGEPWEDTFPLRGKDGEYRWFLSRAVPIRDASGAIVRWFGSNTDVTAQREAQEALHRLTETLEAEVAQRTEERDRMWRQSQDLFVVMDVDGTFVSVNPAWTRVLGWEAEEIIGRRHRRFKHPEDVAADEEDLARLREGISVTGRLNRYRHKDGTYRWISWGAAPEGDLVYAVGRDVTDDMARQAELETAQEQLRQSQKLEAIGQLTGGIAHDFNNLLTIVRTSVGFLRRENLPEERRRRYVEAISEAVDRGSKLTGQLLAFARRQALEPVPFEVGAQVSAMAEMLGSVLGAGIEIVVDTADEPCWVEADRTQFDTALVNMALNAKDAMEGAGRLTLGVICEGGGGGGGGGRVCVALGDTGSGIPPDALARIFEPFFTTKEVGRGTGLGLSQVFGFARQSGGDVCARSRVGEGTVMTLSLPRVVPPPEGDGVEASDDPRTLADGGGRRVLVVEDNREVGAFATQTLQDLGFDTTWVANGEAALAALEEGADRFDVVFSDVVMPGMDGVALARAIRARLPALPVVLTTGYSHVLAEEGLGGFELVRKPYGAEDLSRALAGRVRAS
ncbi:PAS domain S-box protein [Salinarimonas chemoclinalis]|uniref:PAS domain S-box protein n=1 Tax=Salinarimonas chemoclinalis TaxID=3241599 RepID=UPI00355823BE